MSSNLDPNVHRQLGELVAGIRSVQETQAELKEAFRRSEDRSSESRQASYRRMDDLFGRVGSLESSVESVREDVAEMRPVTDDVKRWKLIGVGALGMIGIGGMAIGVTFGEAIRRLGTILLGK